MQSYYGSAAAAKRFEVTESEGELQLPEGIVRSRNGQIVWVGGGYEQEESFRRAAQVNLPEGITALANRANEDCPSAIRLESLRQAIEKYPWPKGGGVNVGQRVSVIPVDMRFPEDLEKSLAWARARRLLGIRLSRFYSYRIDYF
jgi:hypothetical protein